MIREYIGLTAYSIPEAVILLFAFGVLTVILEAPIVLFGFRKSKYKHKILLLILVNILTNVTLNSLILYTETLAYNMFMILFFEIVIVIAEYFLYKLLIVDLSARRIFFISFLANAFSFAVGIITNDSLFQSWAWVII